MEKIGARRVIRILGEIVVYLLGLEELQNAIAVIWGNNLWEQGEVCRGSIQREQACWFSE